MFDLKYTHTLIDSCISNIINYCSSIARTILNYFSLRSKNNQTRLFYSTRIKPKNQYSAAFLFSFILYTLYFIHPVHAISDPSATPDNKFGIHIISPSSDEASAAASLVNSSGGDWGFVTFVIEDKDRDVNKWQQFFNELRARHLIPIVRLATHPNPKGYWEKPDQTLAEDWANFLNKLNWPVQNRYVTIYNEPNHGAEWGGAADPISYAQVLNQTIDALKAKSSGFFVLNAGFDASTPHELPNYEDELVFMKQMDISVPGIFNKLDGFVSHSYPNPGYIGSPTASGRGTVNTWDWELNTLQDLGVTKFLPVFITETGWKHAEGINNSSNLPTSQTVGDYFKTAFETSWNDSRIVAVTPFLLDYQQPPFDHFSFKKVENTTNTNVLAAKYPPENTDFYDQYIAIQTLPKDKGAPLQKNSAQLTKGEVYKSLVPGETYNISLTFKNTGESIWGDTPVSLVPISGQELGISQIPISSDQKIAPEQEHTFNFSLKAPQDGKYTVLLNLYTNGKQFENQPFRFDTEVKSPVILQVKARLDWKSSAAGSYILGVSGPLGETVRDLYLDNKGLSSTIEARYLLPGYSFDFTLERPPFRSKILTQTLDSGINVLDFGTLNLDFSEIAKNPSLVLKILPWIN